MIRLLPVLLVLTGPVLAETARVYSGEHADFTRLVVELPGGEDWTLGRSPMGYGFATAAASQPSYDISEVWKRIPKTRLQAVRTDPETGALQLTLACACYVFPFEYRPGVVVLDIKPGIAPAGSAFEAVFAPLPAKGSSPAAIAAASPIYDWLVIRRDESKPAGATAEIALPTGEVSLDPLRSELLAEISRGAARGVVDMTLPGKPPEVVSADPETLPWSQIHIGPPPDTLRDSVADGKEGRTPEGLACAPDDALALAEWGSNRRPLDLLAEARSGLYGEFDILDPVAVRRAVRLHLYLGFGAEAAQFAGLLAGSGPEGDLDYLQSLALLVDGNSDPQSPFRDMLGCDGRAALWALMAQPSPPSGMLVNADAVARSFLALPPHLRASLGPILAERLLTHGDTEAARIVRNAVERTPDVSTATVALLDAKAELQDGRSETAIDLAETAIRDDGTSVEEWIALVEANFQNTEPISPERVEALRSFEGELEGVDQRQEFRRALALAEVLSGQTEKGFLTAERYGLEMSDIWQVAVTLAGDDSFLREAVKATGMPGVGVAPDTSIRIASRLVSLGFPDAALAWLEPTSQADGPEKRRVAAAAELARADALKTLAFLSGLHDPEDEALRARALVQLGRLPEARAAFLAAGLPDEALRIAAWAGSWADLQAAEAAPWAFAAAEIDRSSADIAGPLARGSAIVEASVASRTSINALLAGVAGPEP